MLAEEQPLRVLGGALAWGRKHGVQALHVVVDEPEAAGVLARRAAAFGPPDIAVWWVDGTTLVPAEAAAPVAQPPLADADAALAPLIVEAGAEPVVEHGVLVGEVHGLEVCRVVDGRLEVGVGKHDREAHRLVHADRPTVEALRAAVEVVRHERPVGLAEARWLRWVVVQRPEVVGARRLEPVAPPLPRGDLRMPSPAPAAGEDGDGAPVLVVCSTGIDIDVVPTAADARLSDPREGVRVVIAVPEGDAHPVTQGLAGLLREPAEVRTVPADWRTLA